MLKRLGKDTIVYGVGAALQTFISFFLFPIYTRLLTKSDFGAQDIVLTTKAMLSLFLVMGLDSAVLIFYYAATDKEKESILSTWFWFTLGLSTSVAVLVFIFAEPMSRLIFEDPTLAPYLRIAVVSIPFSQVIGPILLTLRLKFQTGRYVLLSVVGVLSQATAAIIFVVILRLSVTGIFLALLVASLIQAVVGFYLTRDSFRLTFAFSWLKSLLKVGIPLVPAALSLWVLNYSNRYFLVRYSSLDEIGVLSVALRISGIFLFALSSFQIAWGPFAYSVATDIEAAKSAYAKTLSMFLLLSLTFTVFLSLVAREITILLATNAYEAGASLVPIYCYSSIAWMALYIVGMGTGIAKKTYHTTIAVVLAAIANTVLNFLMIPTAGIVGAAWSTLAGNLVGLVYTYFAGQHYVEVSYERGRIFSLLVQATVVIGLSVWVDQWFVTWQFEILYYKIGIILAYLAALFVSGVVKPEMIRRLIYEIQVGYATLSARKS